jgi:dTDP-4-dehydrorhamnose 3,5-epimerase
MLQTHSLGIDGVIQIRPAGYSDDPGIFSEAWSRTRWTEAGVDVDFIQDNHSLSRQHGVLRGLHFQAAPMAQTKLERVTRGAVFDVAVDVRGGSPSFGQWVSAILSAERWNQLYMLAEFAQGFLTLEAEVGYKVSAPYNANLDRAVRFDDPIIGTDWPIAAEELVLSDMDRTTPFLADLEIGPSYS